jgi:uncharacterized protein
MRLTLLFSILALVSTSRSASAACTRDTDCKGDRVCHQGTCVAPSARPPAPVLGVEVGRPPTGDPVKLERACEGKRGGASCALLAELHLYGRGVPQDTLRAAALYLRACDAKHAEGCVRLAQMYREGDGVALDKDQARTLARKACNAGAAEGCCELGQIVEGPEAVRLYQRACDRKDACGCAWLYNAYFFGQGVTRDEPRARIIIDTAVRLMRESCGKGRLHECLRLAWHYYPGPIHLRDEARSLAIQVKACDLGAAQGCLDAALNLGGRNLEPARTLALMDQSCSRGHAVGCFQAGARHAFDGPKPDLPRGLEQLALSCRRAVPGGCGSVVRLMTNRKVDDLVSRSILEGGCDAGSAVACEWLGWMRTQARGGPQDHPAAAAAWDRGCAKGNANSCYLRAQQYLSGTGGLKDLDKGRSLLKRACEAKLQLACDALSAPPAPEPAPQPQP